LKNPHSCHGEAAGEQVWQDAMTEELLSFELLLGFFSIY
jgi:hypothetical protein